MALSEITVVAKQPSQFALVKLQFLKSWMVLRDLVLECLQELLD